jgi:type II secretory pathway component PulK
MKSFLDIDEMRIDAYALDADWGKVGGGSERDIYALDKGVIPKNAYFDSHDELRLVHGMTDGHMEAFGDAISIYGSEEGKINILSAKDQVVEAVVRFCAANDLDPLLQNPAWMDETVKGWRNYQGAGLGPVSPDGFVGYLKTRSFNLNAEACKSILDVKSANFTVTSTATVNDVTWTLTLVTRVVSNAEEIYYFKDN